MIKIGLTAAALAVALGTGSALAQPATSQDATPTVAAGAPAADDQAAHELREHHRHHHQGGITQFIAMSLDTLGVDDARREKIKNIQHDLHACMAPAGKAEANVLGTIADGVAAGSVDAAKVDTAIGKLGTVANDVHPCSVKALDGLHEVLSKEERQALVYKVEAHWEVWRRVNHEEEAGGRDQGGRLADLAKELSLTPDQVTKLSAELGAQKAPSQFDPKTAEAHMQAFADAFTADSFDAKSITVDANARLAAHGAKRMAAFYETVTPLLTSDQRTTLADHLREHSKQQPAHS